MGETTGCSTGQNSTCGGGEGDGPGRGEVPPPVNGSVGAEIWGTAQFLGLVGILLIGCVGGCVSHKRIGPFPKVGEKWFARGRGRLSPFSHPPPPPLRAQRSGSLKGSGRGSEQGPGGAPPYITSKRSPRRSDHFEVCINGEKNFQNIFRPDFRAILNSMDCLYYIKALTFGPPFQTPPPPSGGSNDPPPPCKNLCSPSPTPCPSTQSIPLGLLLLIGAMGPGVSTRAVCAVVQNQQQSGRRKI